MASVKYIDMYKDFLEIVRKSRVGTVIPKEFARVLNLAIEEAVSSKLSMMEVNKRVYDDLAPLRVSYKKKSLTPVQDEDFDYLLGDFSQLGEGKEYRRIANVTIKTGTKKPIKCHLLSSGEKTEVLNGYYSKPSKHKAYYQPIVDSGNKIKIYADNDLCDYTFSADIYLNPTIVSDTDVVDVNATSQFSKEMSSYIVNIAARMYIESVADVRYKSFMNEQQIKINN